ncbi:hypothetical protein GCM10025857_24310 [Alicyclobacillus contaminans]|uniref:DUF4855 domain-containing protein n=1 Tax=Alicyclobacillus contaminans TaxID=392016 RepID=UPI00041CF779|nr:DUF4855 domain-containing protein [Alicyclobacillus contaminans]GMA51074.1 hypothetical protein GCM10025857_24310 [Alicyclobacillus contaminans]
MRRQLVAAACSLTLAAASGAVGSTPVWADSAPVTDLAPSSSLETTVTGSPDATFQASEQQYAGWLTQGDNWRGYLRQQGRSITVTLPSSASVRTVSIDMMQNPASGIYYPSYVDVEVQSNGQWIKVGRVATHIPLTDRRVSTQTFALQLPGVETTQVRVSFPVGVWVFARHLHIYAAVGGQTGGTVAPISTSDSGDATANRPLSPTDPGVNGIRNMLLVYTGNHTAAGTWTTQDFLPMVGYSSLSSGSWQGRMFDTMLFVPYGTVGDTESAWQDYLHDLFAPNQQLAALDAAVGQINQQLGTYGQKENVVLTLPYPAYGDGVFGTVNGQTLSFDGGPDDALALQARHQALQWYLQQLLADWRNANYSNLKLVGLYWENEAINTERPGEVALVQDAAALAHAQSLSFYWIPYYDAEGISHWRSFGFDAAWLQPNYAELGSGADLGRLRNAEQYATKYGLGLELECTGLDATGASLYTNTINELAADGYAGSVTHAYYDASKLFTQASGSVDLNTRLVYDNTYQFIARP